MRNCSDIAFFCVVDFADCMLGRSRIEQAKWLKPARLSFFIEIDEMLGFDS